MNGLLLIPSLNRASRVETFLKSYKEAESSIPVLVIVDKNDPGLDDYFKVDFRKDISFIMTQGVSMGDKLRETWSIYKDLDHVMLCNDDHKIIGPKEWDKRLISKLNGENFVSTSDGWKTDGKKTLPAGMTSWSGSLIRAVGYIFPPELNHMFIDNIWMDLGLETGCWDLDLDTIISHEHATRSPEWKDDTHHKSESFLHKDAETYLKWRNGDGYKNAIQAIRGLQNGASRLSAM